MSIPAEEPQETYVYRRVHPSQYDSKRQKIKPTVFSLRPDEEGVSVFDAEIVTARGVLQTFIEHNRALLSDEDETIRQSAQKWLDQFPDVETMVEKGWHIIKIPVSEIQERGFHLSDTEPDGHLEIRGDPEQFKVCELEFTELVANGTAPLLSDNDCLAL